MTMTAPRPGEPAALARRACTPAAVRTVLAANADADRLRRYDADLDAAFGQARTGAPDECTTRMELQG
jgi:hypothetical protein